MHTSARACLTRPCLARATRTMRATDDVLAGEHSPLLKETASGDKIRARVDGVSTSATTFNTKTGLFAIGAVAVCGVLALANGA